MTKPVRTGTLAKRAGVLPSTVRHYVNLGLLKPAGRTLGGNFLFDLVDTGRIATIQNLKANERLTLAEIETRLNSNGSSSKFVDEIGADLR